MKNLTWQNPEQLFVAQVLINKVKSKCCGIKVYKSLSLICCISFDSYIKPQPWLMVIVKRIVVYLLIPTSNHNYISVFSYYQFVVYLLIPTSNHNTLGSIDFFLSVVYLLIPTSNHNRFLNERDDFGVVYLLIPTSNHNYTSYIDDEQRLYIFWFLHQTTTLITPCCWLLCCISFDSYIKPQPDGVFVRMVHVVYLLIPTSNHNSLFKLTISVKLYIFWFLHQTTTRFQPYQYLFCCISFDSYIKPQRMTLILLIKFGCISFDSYIKPQLNSIISHNKCGCISFDSYIKPQQKKTRIQEQYGCISFDSYIKPQLNRGQMQKNDGCISFDSYIKPQRLLGVFYYVLVVYLLIPTSNHNHQVVNTSIYTLYIFWFLHQTTTLESVKAEIDKLYIFWFLHQTTTARWW